MDRGKVETIKKSVRLANFWAVNGTKEHLILLTWQQLLNTVNV